MSEKRAVNLSKLSEISLDDCTEEQSFASCLRVYDVEKLADDVDSMPPSVSKACLSCFSFVL